MAVSAVSNGSDRLGRIAAGSAAAFLVQVLLWSSASSAPPNESPAADAVTRVPVAGGVAGASLVDEEEEEEKGDDEGEGEGEGDEDEKKPADDAPAEPKTTTKPLSTDEKYIQDKLEKFIHPTSIEFVDGSRVKMHFDFRLKKEEHRDIFSRKFGASMQDPFRFSVRDEESVVGGDAGLRISNQGVALLNLWFAEDLEAEMEVLQHINHKPSHVIAVVYATEKGPMVGSNYGSQCAMFSKTGAVGGRAGKSEPIVFNQFGKCKIVLRGGKFESHREGRKKSESKYPSRGYESGRVGFVWGGSVSGTICSLTLTGKLDVAMMAKMLRKHYGDD